MHRLTAIVLLALASSIYAQTPSESLSVSAILKDPMGAPLVGPVDIEFLIYDDSAVGMLLWSETQLGIPISADGRFQANLGLVVPLTSSIFATSDRWLTMNVAGDGEMTPRMPLSTVPYAHNSQLLDGSPPSVFAAAAQLDDGDPMTTPVGWIDLSGIPAGFADGTDDAGGAAGGDLTGTYPNPDIAAGAVETNELANLAVTPQKIADAAVQTAKLAGGSVTTAKLGNQSVTTSKLALMSVSTGVISNGAVTSVKLGANAVTSPAIADGTVTVADLDTASVATVFAQSVELNDLNPGTTPIDWADLSSIPAGFADGIDDVGGPTVEDADQDTRVLVEESPDEDTIRFDLAGVERWVMEPGGTLANRNHGGSVFVGSAAGINNDGVSSFNTYLGVGAGRDNISGFDNVAVGFDALRDNDSSGNTAVGYAAMRFAVGGTNNVAIGTRALEDSTVDGLTAVGANALSSNTTGTSNVAIGSSSLRDNLDGVENVAVGADALAVSTSSNNNVAIGSDALGVHTSGNNNIAIGSQALAADLTGGQNIAIGRIAMTTNQSGENNVAVGWRALRMSVDGDRHTALGNSALRSYAGTSNFGDNVAVGLDALGGLLDGNGNTAVGALALQVTTNSAENVAVGRYALQDFDNGSNNTAVGGRADSNGAGLSNSTAIGHNATFTASNQVHLGDAAVSSIGGFVAWTNLSDGRFKRDLKENVPGLDLIKRLRPVTYTIDSAAVRSFIRPDESWQAPGRTTDSQIAQAAPPSHSAEIADATLARGRIIETGFVAQEVEAAAHELGYEFSGVDAPKNDRDTYGLRYGVFVVPLVKAVQEQQQLIDRHSATIANQRAELDAQQASLDALRRELVAIKEMLVTKKSRAEEGR